MALSQQAAAIKHGWRSGLEERVGDSLTARGVPFRFEDETLEYLVPAVVRKYTPDFIITTASGKTIYVETKGRWTREDRAKMAIVIQQHPDKDIRMVFQRANTKIAKRSKTTYAAWCEKHLGVPWAEGDIPDAWIEE
jgi:hypothetical protein